MAESAGDLFTTSSPTVKGEDIKVFEDQILAIKERLTSNITKLEVVSIVGMPGLGKTTLAKEVYEDPYCVRYFDVRAWVTVSQAYLKKNLLLGILSSKKEQTSSSKKEQTSSSSEGELSEELYKSLKGKRYLIVMDDIWDIKAWNELKICLPNDNNGSRVLFTTRINDVASHIKSSNPHQLRFLTEGESWKLFQDKVFPNSIFPSDLIVVGKQIVDKCQGLPLSIVVIGGLLAKTDETLSWWSEVCDSIGSYIASDRCQSTDTMALSYNHLPGHLKPCFLFFGAFPEDDEIDVSRLVWLWIAEGFIQRSAGKSLEQVAEEYLQDLVERSLILIADRSSMGGIKSCSIHDLLHEFCRIRGREENFFEFIYKYENVLSPSSSSSSSLIERGCHRRLCVYFPFVDYISVNPHFSSDVHSFLLCATSTDEPLEYTPSIFEAFNVLRVLFLSHIVLKLFPAEIAQLSHIRYLELRIEGGGIPESICTLNHLETLIVLSLESVCLPHQIWNVKTLRHLHVSKRTSLCCESHKCDTNFHPSPLEDLQTLSKLELHSVLPHESHLSNWDLLRSTPNLKSLSCQIHAIEPIDFLSNLLKLRISKKGSAPIPTLPKLPLSLKKVCLLRFEMDWTEMSKLGRLPNLEVLKLGIDACEEGFWDLNDGEFLQLRVLKLEFVDIKGWNILGADLFPSLERLVLWYCDELESIPLSFGDIATLQLIEVHRCRVSVGESVAEIQEDQLSNGNDQLNILIDIADDDSSV